MKNQTININELIYLALAKDEEALVLLYEQLRNTSCYVYHHLCSSIISKEDWEREALIELNKALIYYREREGCEFRTMYVAYLRRMAIRLLRGNDTLSKGIEFVPLEVEIDGQMYSAENMLARADLQINRMEDQVLNYVACQQVLDLLRPHLQDVENTLLELIRQGYRRTDICKILKISDSRYARTLEKSRKIIQKMESKSPERQSLNSKTIHNLVIGS